jgi:hypothetical protein
VDPVPDPLLFSFSENLAVPGIEPGPPDLWPRTLTTRPQRRRDNIKLDFKEIFGDCGLDGSHELSGLIIDDDSVEELSYY